MPRAGFKINFILMSKTDGRQVSCQHPDGFLRYLCADRKNVRAKRYGWRLKVRIMKPFQLLRVKRIDFLIMQMKAVQAPGFSRANGKQPSFRGLHSGKNTGDA